MIIELFSWNHIQQGIVERLKIRVNLIFEISRGISLSPASTAGRLSMILLISCFKRLNGKGNCGVGFPVPAGPMAKMRSFSLLFYTKTRWFGVLALTGLPLMPYAKMSGSSSQLSFPPA